MVNDAGQLYTMEGIAAGLIMLLAAYIVVSTTSIYTTGDTHIPDMQLEQLGSDVLAMMDTPDSVGGESRLVEFIKGDDGGAFKSEFLRCCNAKTSGTADNLNMSAIVTSRIEDEIKEDQFVTDETWTGRENAVRVTRWVQRPHGNEAQAVLVEVLLWRA